MSKCLNFITIWFLISCAEQSNIVEHELGFTSDAFQFSDTRESQLSVFDSLFFGQTGYELPGNPDPQSLHAFFDELRAGYFVVADGIDYSIIRREYHTFTHAMDVMVTTHALLKSGGSVYFSSGERASLVLAALGHDVLHTGVNNSFLIQTNHPYFQELGEESLQEKRSARFVLELLDKHGILVESEEMDEAQRNEILELRNLIEQSILWTDIKRHNEQMEAMKNVKEGVLSVLQKNRGDRENKEVTGAVVLDLDGGLNIASSLDHDTKTLLASFILHSADISNPGKAWEHSERWSVLVMNEFFSQGDLQKKLGLKPSMNCDRDTVSVPSCQIGFGKFVIRDLYLLLEEVLHDGGGYLLDNFNSNQEKWKALHASGEKTGSPYTMNFLPPSKEGGWMGELRPNEK
jgi:hypothetical protein